MNPLLLDHTVLTLLVSAGCVGGLIRIAWRDLRFLMTHDGELLLTLGLLILLVATAQAWHLLADMLIGAGLMGGIVLGIRIGFGKKFGSGDCLVYPLCGFAIGMDALVIWTLWTAVLLMAMPLGWAWYRGKRVWPLRRLRRIVFPATPPAILALFLTWGVELV